MPLISRKTGFRRENLISAIFGENGKPQVEVTGRGQMWTLDHAEVAWVRLVRAVLWGQRSALCVSVRACGGTPC